MEIVGLKNCVQDDINKLIAKFVGVKPRIFLKELKFHIHHYQSHIHHHQSFLRDLGAEYSDDEDDLDDFLSFHEVALKATRGEYLDEDFEEGFEMMLNEED